MGDSNILLANDKRLASEERSRSVGSATHKEHYQKFAAVPVGALPLPLRRYLKESGGSVEMAVDGSSTAVNFELAPGATEVFRVESIAFVVKLASAADFDKFGDLTALGNGLLVQTIDSDDSEIVDLLGGQAIKENFDLLSVGSLALKSGAGSDGLQAVITPAVPIRLDGAASELLRVTVQDNLTGLTRFRAFVNGVKEDTLT